MITVREAQAFINSVKRNWGTEAISLQHCLGRILGEHLYADQDMPPFDRVTMDGIAINYKSWDTGNRTFLISNTAAAGSPQIKLEDRNACIEVMTGAVLPHGCDTVIRYEDLKIENGFAEIQLEKLTQGINVHQKGSDRKKDSQIVSKGIPIHAGVINIAATIGKSKLKVSRLPKVLLYSTGDELIPVESTPLPHQIRRSNVHMIRTALQLLGIQATETHTPDHEEKIKEQLSQALHNYDIIILSGGVSMGKFDFIPKVMQQLGVEEHFHKVSQRPGKPLWFGSVENGPVVFGLPGNPVSSLACTCRYIIPWLQSRFGAKESGNPSAILGDDVHFKKPLTYFVQVRLENSDGQLIAFPETGNGSGDLANLGIATAFLELPMEKNEFLKGEVYPVYRFG